MILESKNVENQKISLAGLTVAKIFNDKSVHTLNAYTVGPYFCSVYKNLPLTYSLCQKKRTFNPEFFCGLPGGGGPKIHMVDYLLSIYFMML